MYWVLSLFYRKMSREMMELIVVLLIMIAIGAFIYIKKYKNNGKPEAGIKRDNLLDYYKDYSSLKLYWTSIFFMVFGVLALLAILILELIF